MTPGSLAVIYRLSGPGLIVIRESYFQIIRVIHLENLVEPYP